MRTNCPVAQRAASARSRVRVEYVPRVPRNALTSSVVISPRPAMSAWSTDTIPLDTPSGSWRPVAARDTQFSNISGTCQSPSWWKQRTGPPAVSCRRPRRIRLRSHCHSPYPTVLRLAIQTAVEVRVVRLVLRNVEVDIGSVRDAIDGLPDREHGGRIAVVLPDQPAQIPDAVTREEHPERPFAEEQVLLGGGCPRIDERGQARLGGPKRVQRRQPRTTGPLLVLSDDQLGFDARRQGDRRGLRRVELLLDERSQAAGADLARIRARRIGDVECGNARITGAHERQPVRPLLVGDAEPQLVEGIVPDPVVLDRTVGGCPDDVDVGLRHPGNRRRGTRVVVAVEERPPQPDSGKVERRRITGVLGKCLRRVEPLDRYREELVPRQRLAIC